MARVKGIKGQRRCMLCDKSFVITNATSYAYKRGSKYVCCSYTCYTKIMSMTMKEVDQIYQNWKERKRREENE